MFIISGFWVVDVLIYIKVLIVYNIIIYIVYFVFIVLLGLFLKSLIFVKYFILLMIDVIMLRNNYDLVEVLIFFKKKGGLWFYIYKIYFICEN